MVKAPRSKGCRVCVDRRIKCDQTRPYCKRCLRANRQCSGFGLTFVDEGPQLRASNAGSENEQPIGEIVSSASSASPNPLDPVLPNTRSRRSKKSPRAKARALSPIHSDNWQQGAFERGALISMLAPNVVLDQLLANFIASTRQPCLAPTFRSHSSWLAEIAGRPTVSIALAWAIRTISISHLAKKANDSILIETSRRVYGKALFMLNATLQDPQEGLSSDTLSATVLLSFYEIFNCTDGNSWIKHAGGAGRLIQLRGPERHKAGFDRLVFIACRTTLIMDAFQKAAPCFLAEPPWRKLCWEIHRAMRRSAPLRETDEEYLQEIVKYPSYLKTAQDIVGDPDASVDDMEALRVQGLAHRSTFLSIHTRMGKALAEAGSEPVQVASSSSDTLFPVVYSYPDIQIATHYCGFWAITCAINISVIALEAKLAGADPTPTSSPSQGDPSIWIERPAEGSEEHTGPIPQTENSPLWSAARKSGGTHAFIKENARYAREICKSVEYCKSTPFLGPLFLVFAIRLALRMFIKEEEKAWILEKLRDIGREMGLATAEVERYRELREGRYGIEWQEK